MRMEKRTKEQMREKDKRMYWKDHAKTRARRNAWCAANKEKIKAYKAASRAKPESIAKEKLRRRAYYLAHKEQEQESHRAWAKENAERRAAHFKKRMEDPAVAEQQKQKCKAYYWNNREKLLRENKEWRQANEGRQRKYRQDFIAKDPAKYYGRQREWKAGKLNIRISERLRSRIREVLQKRGMVKRTRTSDLIGCSFHELIKHLESLFLPGMTWENYGLHGWHVDHKKACANFDLTDESQQRACFHYTNLQPLWALDNLRKGKWDHLDFNLKPTHANEHTNEF